LKLQYQTKVTMQTIDISGVIFGTTNNTQNLSTIQNQIRALGQFITQQGVWQISPFLQLGTQNITRNKEEQLARTIQHLIIDISANITTITNSLKNIKQNICNLINLVVGTPQIRAKYNNQEIKKMLDKYQNKKIKIENGKYTLNGFELLTYDSQLLTNFNRLISEFEIYWTENRIEIMRENNISEDDEAHYEFIEFDKMINSLKCSTVTKNYYRALLEIGICNAKYMDYRYTTIVEFSEKLNSEHKILSKTPKWRVNPITKYFKTQEQQQPIIFKNQLEFINLIRNHNNIEDRYKVQLQTATVPCKIINHKYRFWMAKKMAEHKSTYYCVKVSTDRSFWRFRNLYHRTCSIFWNGNYCLVQGIIWRFRSLYGVESFYPNQHVMEAIHPGRKITDISEAKKVRPLLGKIKKLWTGALKSVNNFENESYSISKNIRRLFNRVWNYGYAVFGTLLTSIGFPVSVIVNTSVSSLCIASSIIWAPFLALCEYLLNMFIYDAYHSVCSPVFFPPFVTMTKILFNIWQIQDSLFEIGYHTFIGLVLIMFTYAICTVRSIYDFCIFHSIIRWLSPTNTITFAKQIQGPYFVIDHKLAILLLQYTLKEPYDAFYGYINDEDELMISNHIPDDKDIRNNMKQLRMSEQEITKFLIMAVPLFRDFVTNQIINQRKISKEHFWNSLEINPNDWKQLIQKYINIIPVDPTYLAIIIESNNHVNTIFNNIPKPRIPNISPCSVKIYDHDIKRITVNLNN